MNKKKYFKAMKRVAKELFPELDYSNSRGVEKEDLIAIGGKEWAKNVGGFYSYRDDSIVVDMGHASSFHADLFVNTLVHEAIHRYVAKKYKYQKAHGRKFQKACMKFGFDPYLESFHDKTVKHRLFAMDEKDYFKYRAENGVMKDPECDWDDGVLWAYREKHMGTYNRRHPAYKRMMIAVMHDSGFED